MSKPPSDDVSEYYDADTTPNATSLYESFQQSEPSINIAPSSHIYESSQDLSTTHPPTSFGTASLYDPNLPSPADEDLLSFSSPPAPQCVQHHPSSSNNITPGGFSILVPTGNENSE
mmetsp:Transcript_23877/g.35514  ORF Transcript_23877/g.35514 Transcript_23877/m.35514 type:complete len:117 (+) Transcript_23877:91-441(+)